MNRRTPPGSPNFGLRGSSTVYGSGRAGHGRPIMLGVILVTLAVLVWFLFGRVCGGDDCGKDPYCASSRDLAIPDGYELVTEVYELNPESPAVQNPTGGSATVQVQFPVNGNTEDGRNLSFYRFVEESNAWEPLAEATLDPQGKVVQGVFRETPAVVAVLRRLSPAGHVVAYLTHNTTLHPDAINRITILHTYDFVPGTAGEVQGDLSTNLPAGNYAHYPVLAANGASKGDLAIVSQVLGSSSTRSAHVDAITRKVSELGVEGIDIAYMDLTADQRTVFTLFIAELAQKLHGQGKKLSVTLPAPIITGDRVDEGAYDWAQIASEADIVQMAPYRDQSTYRLAMPRILEYFGTIIPDFSKLVLTVTPYATEKSSEGIRTMTITEAMAIAGRLSLGTGAGQSLVTNTEVDIVGVNIDIDEGLSGIIWDTDTAAVAFNYKQNVNRTIWLENFFSIGFKLEYISKFKLGGVAVEDASNNVYLGNIWTALVPFIASGQPVLMQPNENDLVPQWKPSQGVAQAGSRGILQWTTPAEPGQQTITLTLSDGVSLFQSSIVVTVQQRVASTPTAGAGAGNR